MKNGRDQGQDYVAMLEAFIQSGRSLPLRKNGAINVTELGRLSGIPTCSFYQNSTIRAQIARLQPAIGGNGNEVAESVLGEEGEATLPSRENRQSKVQERRVNQLEQHNAALVAENAELRRKLKALRTYVGREEIAIETGRRIPAPPVDNA